MARTLITQLPRRALIALARSDARAFLQGLVTCDMDGVTPHTARYGALLTPQGKILFEFFILQSGDGFLLDCAADRSAELARRLSFYKLRADVTISQIDDARRIFALFDSSVPARSNAQPGVVTRSEGALAFVDPRTVLAGSRLIATREAAERLARSSGLTWAQPDDYEIHRIRLGLGDSGADIGSGERFPHECNLDQLHGVDFDKGCYVGQEVVARMHHRTQIRRRLLPVELRGPADGGTDEITGAGKRVGEILSRAGRDALAVVRLDRAHAAGAALTAGAARVSLRIPPWADFSLSSNSEAGG